MRLAAQSFRIVVDSVLRITAFDQMHNSTFAALIAICAPTS
jgi:hypothetical protein